LHGWHARAITDRPEPGSASRADAKEVSTLPPSFLASALQVSSFCASKGKTLTVAEMKILQQKIGAINIRNRSTKGAWRACKPARRIRVPDPVRPAALSVASVLARLHSRRLRSFDPPCSY
jgi:hypothetical protein